MGLIKLNNIEDFQSAKTLIEDWNISREKKVVYIKSNVSPDLAKPYTTYDEDKLTIVSDAKVEELLTDNALAFMTEIEARKANTESMIAAADAFGLNGFIDTFFFKHRDIIFEYEMNGGSGLYDLFETAEDVELDMANEDGKSPRIYALGLLG